MKIRAVKLDGFGCLTDVHYTLANGLNIFFGPNEIGKSTLQMALLALLYGFYTKNRRNKEEDELLDRFRPWRGEKFGGWLEYAFDDKRVFCVKRDFSGELQTFLTDPLTGRDLSGEFVRGKLGRLDFAEKQLGLGYSVFINTCFVRQADLHHLADTAQKISETMMNLAETGDRDRSVLRAQDLLNKAFEVQVGSERAPTKPLERAKCRLRELESEQTRVTQKRAQTADDFRLAFVCMLLGTQTGIGLWLALLALCGTGVSVLLDGLLNQSENGKVISPKENWDL